MPAWIAFRRKSWRFRCCRRRGTGVKATIFVPRSRRPQRSRLFASSADLVVTGANYGDAAAACDLYRQTSDALHSSVRPARDDCRAGHVGVEWDVRRPISTHHSACGGGGGLAAGMAAQYDGSVRIIGVEPERAPHCTQRLTRGGPVDGGRRHRCDLLGARRIGDLCFDICKRLLAGHVLVSDDAIASAQRLLWRRFRIAVELEAAALAALLSGVYMPGHNERVGVLLCGGNVDLATLAS
ncbi:MAG: pyridoxal-phosphate dependent enzyme [Rhodobiaceae bacterium]|nr:pyridoxal-phosphate dependent enzyme [Rhodobiaceae bacterium]